MTSAARPHKCPTCPAAFGSPAELRQHERSHSAMASMTGGKYNGSAVRQHVPERAEALEMLGEGWPTPAIRFVVRAFRTQDMPPDTYREVRILQQLWHYGDEAKPVSRWSDVPTFEGEG